MVVPCKMCQPPTRARSSSYRVEDPQIASLSHFRSWSIYSASVILGSLSYSTFQESWAADS